MAAPLSERERPRTQSIRYKLIIVEALIFALPLLIISYIFYQGDYHLEFSHLLLFATIVLLILAGMVILRQIFDQISSVAKALKQAGESSPISEDFHKDVEELRDISTSFNSYMEKLDQTASELSQKTLELIAIRELVEFAGKSLNFDNLIHYLLDRAMAVTHAQIGSVFLVDAPSRRFRIVATQGIERDIQKEPFIDIDESVVKTVFTDKKPLLIENIENDPRTLKANDPKYGTPSFISMPIVIKNKVCAILNLAAKDTGRIFDDDDERFLSIMLTEAGFALENAMLHAEVEKHISELEEANKQLGTAYAQMKEKRDELVENLYKEEIGFILNNEGIIEGVTERVLEFTGMPRDKLIGNNFTSLLNETYHDTFREELKQAWMGITHQIKIQVTSIHEIYKTCDLKLTRLTLEGRRLLMALLR